MPPRVHSAGAFALYRKKLLFMIKGAMALVPVLDVWEELSIMADPPPPRDCFFYFLAH